MGVGIQPCCCNDVPNLCGCLDPGRAMRLTFSDILDADPLFPERVYTTTGGSTYNFRLAPVKSLVTVGDYLPPSTLNGVAFMLTPIGAIANSWGIKTYLPGGTPDNPFNFPLIEVSLTCEPDGMVMIVSLRSILEYFVSGAWTNWPTFRSRQVLTYQLPHVAGTCQDLLDRLAAPTSWDLVSAVGLPPGVVDEPFTSSEAAVHAAQPDSLKFSLEPA